MNITLKPEEKLQKRLFDLKTKQRDGLILNIQHEKEKKRFIFGTFNTTGQILILIDAEGSIFLINFSTQKYWNLPKPITNCTAVKFSNYKDDNVLIAVKDGPIHIVNINSGFIIFSLVGHKYFALSISYSRNFLCLTSSLYEAIVWDLKNNSKVQVLSLDHSCSLKQVEFMPVTGNIFTCFDDDTIEIWDTDKFEMKTQLTPKIWRKYPVKNAVFSLDGKVMVLGCQNANLAVILLNNYTLNKLVSLPEEIHSIKHIDFVPNINDGGCNKILAILTGRGAICFFDLESDLIMKTLISETEIIRDDFSETGNYIAAILCSGDVSVYDYLNYIVPEKIKIVRAKSFDRKLRLQKYLEKAKIIKEQIKDILDIEKLRLILKEHKQYPDEHRTKIWEELLQLPNQRDLYNSIIDHRTINSFDNLDLQYPLTSKQALKNVRKVLDNLVTWCPFLLNVDYLPLFAFPFARIFENKPVICFEALCTIIMNWCQYWFEYFPMPPLNILAMIENLLMEHDPELLQFFSAVKLFSETYAWKILQSAFSEVLTANNWKIFWDHVLTNEPAFLLCGVVAYNILQRLTIMNMKSKRELEFFFVTYHPVSVQKLLKKTYFILKYTDTNIHPRQYLNRFKKIDPGKYPSLCDYPNNVINWRNARKADVKGEENRLKLEEVTLLKDRLRNLNSIERTEIDAEESRRILELEKTVTKAALNDQKLLEKHYDTITNLRKLYQEEEETINLLKDRIVNKDYNEQSLQVPRLNQELLDLSKLRYKIRRDEDELMFRYSEMIKNKSNVEKLLNKENNTIKSFNTPTASSTLYSFREPSEILTKSEDVPILDLINGLKAVDFLIKRIESEVEKENESNCSDSIMNLRAETTATVRKVNSLLRHVGKTFIRI